MKTQKNSKAALDQILTALSEMSEGKFKSRIEETDDPQLNSIIAALNQTALALDLQAQNHTKIERELQETKELKQAFQNTVESLPVGVATLDSTRHFKTVNPAISKMLGYSSEELKKLTIFDITHPEDLKVTAEAASEAFNSTQAITHIKRYFHKSGKIVWVRITANYLHPDANGSPQITGIMEDVTKKQELEAENKMISQTTDDGYVIQDSNAAIIKFNPAALKILGMTEDQLLGKTSLDPNWKALKEDGLAFPGEEHPSIVALKTGKKSAGVIMGLNLPSGENRWIRINATPFESNDSLKEKRVICTFTDVTELIASKVENRNILDAMQMGTWRFNPVNQSLIWDKSMYRLFDINEESFSGHYQAWENTLTPESKATALLELDQALRGEKEFDTIFEINTKSRGKRLISGRATVVRDASGAPTMMLGINSDVTELKSREKLVAEQHRQLTQITDSIPGAISRVDRFGRFVIANKAYEDWFGISREQIIGKTHKEVLPPEVFSNAEPKIKRAMTGERVSFETPFDTYDGKKLYVQTTFIPYFDSEAKPDGFIIIVHNITTIKVAEAKLVQSSKMASLGEMSAGIAHEINNPLAIISASMGLLSKAVNDPEKLANKIEVIQKAVNRISKIIAGLKKFSRSADKRIFSAHSLSEIAKEALLLTASKSKRGDTSVTLEAQIDPIINCDEVGIEQVLINLINNAVDAVQNAEEKWIKISISEDKDSVTLRVTDSGTGIPEPVRNKLFQPFYTTKPTGEGTGLGLSITKGILDEHLATISVLPDCKNTCFEIRFPRIGAVKNVA